VGRVPSESIDLAPTPSTDLRETPLNEKARTTNPGLFIFFSAIPPRSAAPAEVNWISGLVSWSDTSCRQKWAIYF
jgi:hypothetical protein